LSVTLASDLHRACNSIAEHVRSVTNGCTKILKMNLYFKVDILERLILVMCTDIQIQVNNTEQDIVTIHPMKTPSFKFSLPKFVLDGNFTKNNLDEDINSDYEDN